jgi:hypothetical protein
MEVGEVIMRRLSTRLLFWTPRVLGLLFALFLSIFALDVFGQGYGFWGTILALVMHFVPVYIVLIALAVAWRWPWAGALLFAGLSLWYLIMMWEPYPLAANLLAAAPIAAPLLVIGLLFLLNWFYRPQLQGAQ